MKSVLFLSLILLQFNLVVAQGKEIQKSRDKYSSIFETVTVDFEQAEINDTSLLPFSRITVWDARADTNKIGFFKTSKENNATFKKIVVRHNLTRTSEIFFDQTFAKSYSKDKRELLMVIRKLFFNMDYEYFHPARKSEKIKNPYYLLHLKVDFHYNAGNSFVPLKKIDSIILFTHKFKSKRKGLLIGSSLINVIKPLIHINIDQFITGRKIYSAESLAIYYLRQTQYPIIIDTSLKDGVYKTFREFKQNSPSITNFIFQNKKKSDEVYEIRNGDTTLMRNIWGVCSEGKIFFKSGNQFYRLHKQGNTFEVLSASSSFGPTKLFPSPYYGGNIPGSISSGDLVVGILHNALSSLDLNSGVPLFPFQLDMETGEFN